jgi:alpha-L-arabinofuranosidase
MLMWNTFRLNVLVVLFAFIFAAPSFSPKPEMRLTIDAGQTGPQVSPMMHGVFFEDINYGADGGLYAELVQNRSFEHLESLYSWAAVSRGAVGTMTVESADPLDANNPHYLRLNVRTPGKGFGAANYGFGGIAVKQSENYLFSVRARADAWFKGALAAVIEDETGQALGQCKIEGLTGPWKKFDGTIRSSSASSHARLVVLASAEGRVDLDVVSLFPENTWKRRRNGLRADLVQMLAGMKPAFIRFPGGCIVEGKDLANAYRWKDTIGDIAERKQNWNRWQDALHPGHAPQYYQTYGLGFFEYFQMCEDLGAEPVPILNCGMSCQYQDKQLVPLDRLDPFVQDALDLIEFANAPASTPWGAKRAAMGHPEPFRMKYVGIGNEQWDEVYFERYLVFYRALKARYPDIKLVTTSGPGVDDQWWKLAWGKFRSGTPADIVDEHYYRAPSWFLDNYDRYDRYDRRGPKVFAGEFAAHDGGAKPNNLRSALSEAAFMTGLLRNAEVVVMSAYAPLFAKAGSTQWTPDLIWFDNTRAYGSSSYHVQAMYGRNRPDVIIPLQVEQFGSPAAAAYPGQVGVGTWFTQAEFKDITVTRDGRQLYRSDFSKGLGAWSLSGGKWDISDGTLRQNALGESDVRALVGDFSWSDYTLSLKARKLAGREGFLIFFQSAKDGTVGRWNIGGWNNEQHRAEGPGFTSDFVRGIIETGRWYDIRVELTGPSARCYLDGKLIHEVTRKAIQPLYVVAGRDRTTGEIILSAVNPSGRAVTAEVLMRGVTRLAPMAKATVLTSAGPDDQNSFETPARVAPREEIVNIAGPSFRHAFPPYSFTILRLK